MYMYVCAGIYIYGCWFVTYVSNMYIVCVRAHTYGVSSHLVQSFYLWSREGVKGREGEGERGGSLSLSVTCQLLVLLVPISNTLLFLPLSLSHTPHTQTPQGQRAEALSGLFLAAKKKWQGAHQKAGEAKTEMCLERERERGREVYGYIYIYTYMHTSYTSDKRGRQ